MLFDSASSALLDAGLLIFAGMFQNQVLEEPSISLKISFSKKIRSISSLRVVFVIREKGLPSALVVLCDVIVRFPPVGPRYRKLLLLHPFRLKTKYYKL